MRTSPNIIVTGTPGVGKTTHCESLAERTGLRHLSVNQVVKDKECHEGWSDEYHSWIVDEDKVRPGRRFKKEILGRGMTRINANTGVLFSCWMLSRMMSRLAVASSTGTPVTFSPRAGSIWSWCSELTRPRCMIVSRRGM